MGSGAVACVIPERVSMSAFGRSVSIVGNIDHGVGFGVLGGAGNWVVSLLKVRFKNPPSVPQCQGLRAI